MPSRLWLHPIPRPAETDDPDRRIESIKGSTRHVHIDTYRYMHHVNQLPYDIKYVYLAQKNQHAILPAGLKRIDASIFYWRRNFTTIAIPDSVTEIGNGAFDSCTDLISVIIPQSVTRIGAYAFAGCTSLRSVVLPASVTEIGENAFFGTSLSGITIPNTCNLSMMAFGPRVFPNQWHIMFGQPRFVTTHLSPARMRACERLASLWREFVVAPRVIKRYKPQLYAWWEAVSLRLRSFAPGGAGRKRDREAFEHDFGPGCSPSSASPSGLDARHGDDEGPSPCDVVAAINRKITRLHAKK